MGLVREFGRQTPGDLGIQRRQVVEACQAKAFEKIEAGPVQDGTPGALRASELQRKPAVDERADRVVGVDAPDALDDRLGDRLAIRDDGECFQRGL